MKRVIVGLFVVLASCSNPGLGGELEVQSGAETPRVIAPKQCASGEPLLFFGVDMWTDAGWDVRFLHDPIEGPAVLVDSPGEDAWVIHPEHCEHFRGELRRRDPGEDETVGVMYGHLELRCALEGDTTVEGSLHFDRCQARP